VHDLKGAEKHILVGWRQRDGPRISQSGLYDDSILCAKCDGELGKLDAFAIGFCRDSAKLVQEPFPNIFKISPAGTAN
jgi:hypothetical protein